MSTDGKNSLCFWVSERDSIRQNKKKRDRHTHTGKERGWECLNMQRRFEGVYMNMYVCD